MRALQKDDVHDTHLTPALFADGSDRRTSPRVPFEQRVRVGAAYGAPYATVRAENLAAGGIFILTDDPAALGARFSVELGLPTGETLYIPQAEVLYNRPPAAELRRGFGAKFTEVPAEVLAMLKRTVAFPSELTESDATPTLSVAAQASALAMDRATVLPVVVADSATPDFQAEIPSEPFDEQLSYPEPASAVGPLEEETDVVRDRRPRQRHSSNAMRKIRGQVAKRARTSPLLWGSLVACGVGGILLAGTMLSGGDPSDAHARQGAVNARGMEADTHAVLVGAQDSMVGVEPEPPAAAAPVRRETSAAGAVRSAPLVAAKALQPEAPPAPPRPEVAAEPVRGPAASSRAEPTVGKGERPVAKRAVEAPRAGSAGTVAIAVDAKATVLRTHVLRAPDRFVIDLRGQPTPPRLPPAKGTIRGIRVGQHDGYTRLVIDSSRAIARAHASRAGGNLVVRLEH